MLSLPVRARKFIDIAVKDMNPHDQRTWNAWAAENLRERQTGDSLGKSDPLPRDVLAIVLAALEHLAKGIEKSSHLTQLTEDARADLANDLRYISSIQSAILGQRANTH